MYYTKVDFPKKGILFKEKYYNIYIYFFCEDSRRI